MISAHKLTLMAALSLLLVSCAGWDAFRPQLPAPATEDVVAAENERAALALAALPGLDEVDVLMRLDNTLLKQQMEAELADRAQFIEAPSIRDIHIDFGRQLVRLSARLDVSGPAGESVAVELSGDVRLAFSGKHLIWLPQFHEASMQRSRQAAADGSRLTLGELAQHVERINREITDAVIIHGQHTIFLNPVPMGRIEVGAAMEGFPEVLASQQRQLGGVFTVAGSAILIEPDVTSVALDLEFVPNISTCTPNLSIGRAGFASAIEAREPVGVSRYLEAGAEIRHFFTEVRGAKKSTAIVHYWFADGRPVGVEELPIDPSERWRTWSSKTIGREGVRNWEVVVVERDTGCILHSQAIRAEPDVQDFEATAHVAEVWQAYREAFQQRLGGFSIMSARPAVAQIEIRRQFLSGVLRQSLQDIQLDTVFELAGQTREFQALLRPFSAEQVACEPRECAIQRSCGPTVSRCLRRHDTRDCTTCLFRNPLNNRCVNEAEDPICVAARAAQNDAYEAARQACLREEQAARLDCQRLRAQEMRSCEMEAASAKDTCQAAREALRSHGNSAPLAKVNARVNADGRVVVRHSGFELGEDLNTLAMSVEFRSLLGLKGSLQFSPVPNQGPLAKCLSAWQAPFEVQLTMPATPYRVIGNVTVLAQALVTEWSGIVLATQSSPSPLEAMFVEHPEMLADCQLGLRVADVVKSLAGDAPGFFGGALDVVFKPSPSKIVLAPASLEIGGSLYQAEPVLDDTRLSFDIREGEDG